MRLGRRVWRGFPQCGAVPQRVWEPAWGWGPSAYAAWDVGSAGRGPAGRGPARAGRGRVGWVHVRESAWGWGPRAGVSVGWEPLPAASRCGPGLRGAGPVRRSACMAAGCAPLGAGARAVVRRRGPPGVARTSAVWCGFTPCRVAILWRTYAEGGLGACGGPCGCRRALHVPRGPARAAGSCVWCGSPPSGGALRVRGLACAVGACVWCGSSACGAGSLRVVRALRVWCRPSAGRRSSGGARPVGGF